MAKKKTNALAALIKKAKAAKKVVKSNPMLDDAGDALLQAGTGLGGFAATHFVANAARTWVTPKVENTSMGFLAPHIDTVTALLALAGIYYGAARWAPQHADALTVGAGIAVATRLVAKYMPGMSPLVGGNMVSSQASQTQTPASTAIPAPQPQGMALIGAGSTDDDDLSDLFTSEDLDDDDSDDLSDLSGNWKN